MAVLISLPYLGCTCIFFLLLAGLGCKGLFGPFWGGKSFALIIPPCIYVLVVGPKPSLLRALGGMYMFQLAPPLSKRFSLLVPLYLTGGFLQVWLFPSSVMSFAFLYSYGAFAMILFGSGLPPIPPLLTTALAIIGTGPASMILLGTWNPAGLLYSIPPATLLINLAMLFSLLTLSFGSWFSYPLALVYRGEWMHCSPLVLRRPGCCHGRHMCSLCSFC